MGHRRTGATDTLLRQKPARTAKVLAGVCVTTKWLILRWAGRTGGNGRFWQKLGTKSCIRLGKSLSVPPCRSSCDKASSTFRSGFQLSVRPASVLVYFFFFSLMFSGALPLLKSAVAETFSFSFFGFLASLLPRCLSPFDMVSLPALIVIDRPDRPGIPETPAFRRGSWPNFRHTRRAVHPHHPIPDLKASTVIGGPGPTCPAAEYRF